VANRSFLYRCDDVPDGKKVVRPQGLHEWNWTTPIVQLLLAASEPVLTTFTTGEEHVAIVAKRDDELAFAFYRAALHARPDPDLAKDVAAMEAFLSERPSTHILLDASELFAMERGAATTHAKKLIATIEKTAKRARRAIADKEPAMFEEPRALGELYDRLNQSLAGDAWSETTPPKYSATATFAAETQLDHPTFGIGYVLESKPGRVTVVFGTTMRTLAQAK
jgi:hypothetical protein